MIGLATIVRLAGGALDDPAIAIGDVAAEVEFDGLLVLVLQAPGDELVMLVKDDAGEDGRQNPRAEAEHEGPHQPRASSILAGRVVAPLADGCFSDFTS